ncbi:hypothetical protein [Amycolatopsis eburnea]|uniref:Uncharacterized protein n=1 Tax=Amycolatopsis eburnea TaxID=2267691 RepID=A0A3R9FRB6_9PSEU|nr:hypothetical protein [Amycolatopsis eburnea]RSD22013.1 hypothetical protein EIY87_09360 [Amycolatopsis eburnea]
MGQINLPANLLDRLKRAEAQITQLWKNVGLSSATIAAGGLTLLNNAYLKMLGASNNEIVYIGPDGLGNQVVRIRDAAGNIIFGSVSAGGASQRVAINPNPAGSARIEFYDDGNTTDRVSLSLNGGNFVQQREVQATSSINGGKVSFYNGLTYFGHQTASLDTYLRFNNSGEIALRGKWTQDNSEFNETAVFVGNYDLGSAATGASVSWGPTMATRMSLVTDIFLSGGTVTSHNIDAISQTGFGVRWSPSSTVRVMYHGLRINQAW